MFLLNLNWHEDCGCELVIGPWIAGCKIIESEPPPKGYMCNCNYYFFHCSGTVVPCIESESDDCSGCSACKCCSEEGWTGNCNGYLASGSEFPADDPKCRD